MGLHNDVFTYEKLAGIGLSGGGIALWKFAKQPQLGAVVAAVGAVTTLYAGSLEMTRKADELKQTGKF